MTELRQGVMPDGRIVTVVRVGLEFEVCVNGRLLRSYASEGLAVEVFGVLAVWDASRVSPKPVLRDPYRDWVSPRRYARQRRYEEAAAEADEIVLDDFSFLPGGRGGGH